VASTQWTEPYHRDFEELMREYDGRPHWGMENELVVQGRSLTAQDIVFLSQLIKQNPS